MKEQYVGDENDYRKYALLRHFALRGEVRIGVCWMLTPADGRTDGSLTKYLDEPPLCDDEELFAKLISIAGVEGQRRLHLVEREKVIPGAVYFDEFISDRAPLRRAYFETALDSLGRADLIFFDPDNGVAPPSVPRGAANSGKYIYRDELHDTYIAGHSLLVYQHFTREPRTAHVERLAIDLAVCAPSAQLWCFSTPRTAFFLMIHPRHAPKLAPAATEASHQWNTSFISGRHIASPA
jgi:hypothetical protein